MTEGLESIQNSKGILILSKKSIFSLIGRSFHNIIMTLFKARKFGSSTQYKYDATITRLPNPLRTDS